MSRPALLSHAPEDRAVALRLVAALRQRGERVAIGGSQPSEHDRPAAIEDCDALVLLVSDAAIASPRWRGELDRAVAANVRVVPVLLGRVDRGKLPAALADREWIVLGDGDSDGAPPAAALGRLVEALRIDPAARDEHERIAERTGQWLADDGGRSVLLRGADLREAQAWLERRPEHRETPTADEGRFLAASTRAAIVRQRTRLGAVLVALLVTASLAIVAVLQRGQATSAQRVAVARGVAARSSATAESDPALAATIGVEAYLRGAAGASGDAIRLALGRLGADIGTLNGNANSVSGLAFGPRRAGRGPTLVTGGADGSVRIWDVASRTQIGAPLRGHRGRVAAVALRRDGALIASAGSDGTLRLWSVAHHHQSGAALGRYVRPRRRRDRDRKIAPTPLTSVAFGRHDTMLATASNSGAVRLWDVARRRRVGRAMRAPKGAVDAVAFSPDGRTLAAAGADGAVRLWDVQTQAPAGRPLLRHSGRVVAVAFSPNGSMIASGGFDGTTRLWSLATHKQSGHVLRPGRGMHGYSVVGSVAFSPDGSWVASGGADALYRWDVATHRPLGPPLHAPSALAIAFSRDGRTIASAGIGRGVRLWNVARGASAPPVVVLPRLPLDVLQPGSVTDTAFRADGRVRVSASSDGAVRLWNVAANTEIGAPLTGHTGVVRGVAISPGGELVASAGDDGTVLLWSVARHRRIGAPLRGRAGKRLLCVALSRDRRLVAAGGTDGRVRLWSVATHRLIRSFRGDPKAVEAIAFSPGAKTLAFAGIAGVVELRSVATGRPLGGPLPGHLGPVDRLSFNPRGTILASGSLDKTVRLWDVATHRPLGGPLVGHTSDVQALAFSGDGKILASGAFDQTVRLWDVATHAPIGPPLPASGAVGLAFRPDGSGLIAGDEADNETRWDAILWRGDDAARRSRACAAARRDLSRSEWRRLLPGVPYRRTCSAA